MGMPAFLGYYVTHDLNDGTMAFAPHRESHKPALEKKDEELKIETALMTMFDWDRLQRDTATFESIMIFSFIFSMLLIWYLFWTFFSRKANEDGSIAW